MRRQATLPLGLLLTLAFVPPADSQTPAPMESLAWLAGEWEGEGWQDDGRGNRREFIGTEKVEARLDGSVLIIEGRHTTKDTPSRLIHHAVGVVAYDTERRGYHFRAYAKGRPPKEAEAALEGNAFVWSMETPGGTVRYRVRQSENGDWHEVGETAVGAGKWAVFFEMTMRRVR